MASWPSWYPALLALTQITGSALLIGLTPGDSFVRLAALPGFALILFHFISVCSSSISDTFIASTNSGIIAHFFLQYVEAALISKWDFKARAPLTTTTNSTGHKDKRSPSQRRHEDSVWARLRFGVYVTCSCRYCGTPWEVKNVPPFHADNRSKIPTRKEFLTRSLRTFVLYFLIIDAISTSADPAAAAKWTSRAKIPFFARIQYVGLEEVVFRILTTVSFIGVSYLTVIVCFTLPAITSVALGMSDVSWWRPLFGSLADAYTIRGFWGKFWHQQHYRRWTNVAETVIFKFLRLPRKSISTRYVRIFFVFFLSGLHHLIIDYGNGLSWLTSGAMHFYITQASGIVFEDAVRALWTHLFRAQRSVKDQEEHASRGEKIFGYVWVLLWLSWSYPATIYPILEANMRSGSEGLPVSIFRPAIKLLK